jgi:transcriptional regulator GlxA family with amidase domain
MTGCGVSGRQLGRRFRVAVGVGPKLLARVLRFRHAWELGHAGPVRWPALALACGYCDQAHLIRDFRRFAGTTPAAAVSDLSKTPA